MIKSCWARPLGKMQPVILGSHGCFPLAPGGRGRKGADKHEMTWMPRPGQREQAKPQRNQPRLFTCSASNCFQGQLLFSCSVVSDSATPWTVACQASLSMGVSRQEYWSGLPFPSPGSPQQRNRTHISFIACIAARFFTMGMQTFLPQNSRTLSSCLSRCVEMTVKRSKRVVIKENSF